MIDYKLNNKKLYNKELDINYEGCVNKYIKILIMFLTHYKNIISDKDELDEKIKIIGLNSLNNIFLTILMKTKNINATLHNCEKTIFYYFEFIDQMNKPKSDIQSILKLTVYDAKLFVYKKTIYEIIELEMSCNYENNQLFSKLINYSIIIINILEILLKNEKIIKVIDSFNDIVNKIRTDVDNKILDDFLNIYLEEYGDYRTKLNKLLAILVI